MTFTRGRSAMERLNIAWDVPIYSSGAVQHTSAAGPLTRREAFEFLAGDDKRPLLVLRECQQCAGTDLALLRTATNNERTMLLTRWFHCVKLPSSVLHARHSLRNLFPGKRPPHLFFSTADGEEIVTLPGNQTQSAVWRGLTKLIRKTYEKSPTAAVKKLLATLDEFDDLDGKQLDVRRRLDAALEKDGPSSPKFKKLKRRFEKLEAQRKALLAREKALLDLKLRD